MRKEIYRLITKKLAEVPEVRHIGVWNNQVYYADVQQPFLCPAVFVEFTPIDWKILGNRVRESEITFSLHLVTDSRVGSDDEITQVFDLSEKINAAIHGTNQPATEVLPKEIGCITCKISTTDNDFGELMHNVDTFICHVKDYSASKNVVTENLKLTLK